MNKENPATIWGLVKKVHNDERGAVSIETILVIAVIALPILIFILKYGWPKIKDVFEKGLKATEGQIDTTTGGEYTSGGGS